MDMQKNWIIICGIVVISCLLLSGVAAAEDGFLLVKTEPAGAGIFVDSLTNYLGDTPKSLTINSGVHSLLLRKQGYQDNMSTINVVSGQAITVSINLTKTPPTAGTLNVESIPSGAQVFLTDYNNFYLGMTPLVFPGLDAGNYMINVTKPEYYPLLVPVTIIAGQVNTTQVTLVPIPKTGKAQIGTNPPGALILVNNEFRGYTPSTLDFAPGSYSYNLSLDGYYPAGGTFSVTAGATTDVSVTLDKIPPMVTVYFNTTPMLANILVDGVLKGVSPGPLNLAAGKIFSVVFSKQNYLNSDPLTIDLSLFKGGEVYQAPPVVLRDLGINITPTPVNGVITPVNGPDIIYGADKSYMMTPNFGYHVTNVIADGEGKGPRDTYTFKNVVSNHTITALFDLNVYTIAASTGPGGSINPSGNVSVTHGTNQVFTVSAFDGYYIDKIFVDGIGSDPKNFGTENYTFTSVIGPHTINATFGRNPWTISATSTQGGYLSPNGSVKVKPGNSQSFSIVPNPGFITSQLIVNSIPVQSPYPAVYTFSNVTSDQSIYAGFSQVNYTVTAIAGPNGSISPSGITTYSYGATPLYSIIPNPGFSIANVRVNNVSVGTLPTYQFTPITQNQVISADFATNIFSINATAGIGGSINPSGNLSYNASATPIFIITPNTGYSIADVVVNGISVGKVNSYQFPPVSSNGFINAKFSLTMFNITATSGPYGNITPSGIVQAGYGTNQTFSFTPYTGYSVDKVFVDNGIVPSASNYTFVNVNSDHSVSVAFNISVFTITPTAGTGGTISPSVPIGVAYNGTQGFSISPDSCDLISDVLVDGKSVGALPSYIFTSVISGHTIDARFAIKQYSITPQSGTGGTITPSTVTKVNCSGVQTFTMTPSYGYVVDDVIVDGKSVGPVTSYTTAPVTKDFIIAVKWKLIPSGTIFVSSDPTGAQVFIDGVRKDISGTPVTITNIPVGERTITLKAPFYKDYTTKVTVPGDGKTIKINAKLSK